MIFNYLHTFPVVPVMDGGSYSYSRGNCSYSLEKNFLVLQI